MPTDLERAFAALSDDAGRVRLAPAAVLRKRADRQVLTRSLTGAAAAALLVAGIAVGSRLVLADDALPPLPPLQSTAPAPAPTAAPTTASPSATPSSPPSSDPAGPTSKPTEPVLPRSIPARAFLTRSDANVMTLTRLEDARSGPALCDEATYPSTRLIGVKGSVQLLFRPEGTGEGYTASGSVTDTITVFRSGGAEDFLDEFRAAARDCPRGEREGLTYTYRALGSLGTGDESLLVEGATPARGDNGELTGNGAKHYIYLAAVRVGDAVALVETTGFESVSAEREEAEDLTRKAAQRLTDWRS